MVDLSIVMWLFTRGYYGKMEHDGTGKCPEISVSKHVKKHDILIHFAQSLASILFALFHATKNTDHGPCTKLFLAAGTKQFADSFHPSRAAFCNRLGSALVTW